MKQHRNVTARQEALSERSGLATVQVSRIERGKRAVIARAEDGSFMILSHNDRFSDTVAQSTCAALNWGGANRLKSGAIAELLTDFFDGTDPAGELDFRDGEGVSGRYFRIKLAPLPRGTSAAPRCLLSVVDRTVEVQAERTLRAEMLRDSLTGLPNRLAFTEAIEKAGGKVARDLEHAVLVVDMLRFSRINESMGSLAGDELLITFARRLIHTTVGFGYVLRTEA